MALIPVNRLDTSLYNERAKVRMRVRFCENLSKSGCFWLLKSAWNQDAGQHRQLDTSFAPQRAGERRSLVCLSKMKGLSVSKRIDEEVRTKYRLYTRFAGYLALHKKYSGGFEFQAALKAFECGKPVAYEKRIFFQARLE